MHEILLFVAKYLYLFVGLIAIVCWLKAPKHEKLRLLVFGVIAAIITFVLIKIGAALYYDPRPFVTHHIVPLYPHAADNGFPSDHTVLAALIAMMIFSSSEKMGVFLLVLSALIGASRVMGHIHSPVDIVGSFVFAAIGYAVALWATPQLLKHIGPSHEHLSSN